MNDGYTVGAEEVEILTRPGSDRRPPSVTRRPANDAKCHLLVDNRPLCKTTRAVEHLPNYSWANVPPDQRCTQCSSIADSHKD